MSIFTIFPSQSPSSYHTNPSLLRLSLFSFIQQEAVFPTPSCRPKASIRARIWILTLPAT
jgi:hypothetical protein